MNLETAERIWLGIKITFLCVAITFCILIFNSIQRYIAGYEPKNFAEAGATELEQILKKENRPVLVYFYHKKNAFSVRKQLPAMDQFALIYGSKIQFYKHQFNDPESEKFKPYKTYEGLFVIFEDGHESKKGQLPIMPIDRDNSGALFLFLKDYFALPSNGRIFRSDEDWHLTKNDFQERVLNAKKPVVIDFTDPMCSACQVYAPQFKAIGEKYGDVADFYYAGISLGFSYGAMATPTTVLFYKGKVQTRRKGAYSNQEGSEAMIVGMLMPYIDTGIESSTIKR